MFVGADLIAQKIVKKPVNEEDSEWDTKQTARMAALGTFCNAPLLHNWFGSVLPSILKRFSVSRLWMPIFSCAVHHSMFFPWFSYMFLFANTFFDSFKLKESVDFATDKFWVTYWHAVKVVFVVNLLGFAFVPAPYQGLLQTFSMLCVHTAQQRNWTEEDPVEPEDELNEYEFEKIVIVRM